MSRTHIYKFTYSKQFVNIGVCLWFEGAAVGHLLVSGNNNQIRLTLDANVHGFVFNATSRNVIVGRRLRIAWPSSVNQITVTLTLRCSPIVPTSTTEVSV